MTKKNNIFLKFILYQSSQDVAQSNGVFYISKLLKIKNIIIIKIFKILNFFIRLHLLKTITIFYIEKIEKSNNNE